MIRIQTGEDRGKELKMPKTPSIRPSTNKVREALVDILRSKNLILGARVLDIYAGTGAVGFELLSNGAVSVTFVERSQTGIKTIKENAQKLKKTEAVKIIKEDAAKALEKLSSSNEKFDLIYADPPYNITDKEISELEDLIYDLLNENGVFILEHSSKLTYTPRKFTVLTQKKYGDTMLSFYGKG